MVDAVTGDVKIVEAPAAQVSSDPTTLTADEIFNNTFGELANDEPTVVEDKAPIAPIAKTVVEGDLPDPSNVPADGVVQDDKTAVDANASKTLATDAPKPEKSIEDVMRELLAEREAPKPEAVKEAPKPEPYKVPDFTAEQKAIVDAYEKDFPEVATAEQIIRSREYLAVTDYIFTQVRPIVEQQAARIQQLETNLRAMAGGQQAQSLEAQLGESLESLKPKVAAWIETQPDFIKGAYKNIYDKGTAAEVLGLVGEFRKATGAVPPAKTAADPTPPNTTPTLTLPTVKAPKKVPAGLTPVPSVRTVPADTSIAKDDFNGAFAAFAKAAGA